MTTENHSSASPKQPKGSGEPYWRKQAIIRQAIINKQDKTIRSLTASVVQLENDYDTVENELRALLAQQPAPSSSTHTPQGNP